MAADHHSRSHGHSHGVSFAEAAKGEVGDGYRRPLTIALVLVVGFVGVQGVAGVITGSLALLSDAGHMATDALGLAMALAAVVLGRRAGTDRRHTFGLYRLEILAAAANAVLLLGVGAYVLVEAVIRVGRPVEIDPVPVLVVGALGLAVNVVCFWLLRRGAQHSINVRGAYLEVVADMLGSVGVVIGAVVIWLTSWFWVDAVIGAAIGLFIVPRALRLGLDAARILLQQSPRGLDLDAVTADLAAIDRVVGVHDLHVWTLTSDMEVLTAHLVTTVGADSAEVLCEAQDVLAQRYGLDHVTLQIEPAEGHDCLTPSW